MATAASTTLSATRQSSCSFLERGVRKARRVSRSQDRARFSSMQALPWLARRCSVVCEMSAWRKQPFETSSSGWLR